MIKRLKEKYRNYNKNNHCKCGKLITNISIYCLECNAKLHSKRMKGKNHPNFGKKCLWLTKRNLEKGINKPHCKDCGKELSDYRTKRCSYCSKIGKNNANFKHGNGYAPYPSEFNNELKEKIRKRDNYICQNCGMTEEEHLIVIGRTLDIHHIDYNKENCNEYNLISLCQQCNLRANSNRDYWFVYYRDIIEVNCDKIS